MFDIDGQLDIFENFRIEGRRKLYFVGDWVDEFCDLTLDQIADVLYEGMDTRPSEATGRLDREDFGVPGL